jgi:peptidoglycan/xylan/chitin deacetylase (PgdA/CDA1 family)
LVKRAILLGLSAAGPVWPRRGIPILCYHSIDRSGSLLSMTPELFQRQMELLHVLDYRTLSLGAYCERMRHGDLPTNDRMVVLTFDDGYRNNYTVAFPVMRRFGFTATLFIATGYVGGRNTWYDGPDLEMASWEELREMSAAGFEIAPHTITHPRLNELPLEAALREVEDSRKEIESRVGAPARVFAYPYGVYTHALARRLEALDYLGAVTIESGLAKSSHDPLLLPRVNATEVADVDEHTKMLHFRCGLTGSAAGYTALKEWFPSLVKRGE